MITIYRRRELPPTRLFWLDDSGDPVSFTSGTWSWTVSLEQDLVESTLSGVTVTINSNPTTYTASSSDVSSLTLSFAAGSLDNVSVGPGTLIVVGTSSGLDREGRFEVVVR